MKTSDEGEKQLRAVDLLEMVKEKHAAFNGKWNRANSALTAGRRHLGMEWSPELLLLPQFESFYSFQQLPELSFKFWVDALSYSCHATEKSNVHD